MSGLALHYRSVPKSPAENLLFRRSLLSLAGTDPGFRRALREYCRLDLLFYVNCFVMQYNPRNKGPRAVGPFITWDFQDEALLYLDRCIDEDEDVIIEKSREMGASWLCLILLEWRWHWHEWQKFLVISRNEDAVDADDPDSLFWKIDFMHRYMPPWMMPLGWDAKKHRKQVFFENPETNSTITGQASTGKAGVGGRATAMFIDEFSQIREDREVLHRTSDTTGCRIFNGTHKGIGTAFQELTQRPDMRKIVMHWSQHPEKFPGAYRWDAKKNRVEIVDKTYQYPPDFNFVQVEAPAGGPFPGLRSPWYDDQCVRKGSPRAVAMDLDIDAGGSVAQFFNPVTIRVLRQTYCTDPVWEGDVQYDRDTGKPVGLVAVPGGPLRLWVQPMPNGKLPTGKYGAGADLSTGVGATKSCLSVIDATTGAKVASYATPHVTPENLAPIFAAVCWLFQDDDGTPAYFGWEHHGPGLIFGKKIVEMAYPRFYWREAHGTLAGGKLSNQPGWYPSPDNKRLLLEEYRAALDQRRVLNPCDHAMKECLPYRYTAQGTVEHPLDSGGDDHTGARVNHGDHVIADALAWKMASSFGIIGRKRGETKQTLAVGSLAWRKAIHEEREREEAYLD